MRHRLSTLSYAIFVIFALVALRLSGGPYNKVASYSILISGAGFLFPLSTTFVSKYIKSDTGWMVAMFVFYAFYVLVCWCAHCFD